MAQTILRPGDQPNPILTPPRATAPRFLDRQNDEGEPSPQAWSVALRPDAAAVHLNYPFPYGKA